MTKTCQHGNETGINGNGLYLYACDQCTPLWPHGRMSYVDVSTGLTENVMRLATRLMELEAEIVKLKARVDAVEVKP
jgi:hypothetical protein